MSAWALLRLLNREQRNTFLASFLGWTLDAFDYFLLTFVTLRISSDFRVALAAIVFSLTLTLAMRPVGALIFGLLAERFGRRTPLMIDIILYSIIELLTAFSPNYAYFIVMRALFGVAMGGEWGLGSSLAMETLPTEARGFFSGILQQGYAFGYLIAALIYFAVFTFLPAPLNSWRTMFVIGVLPAILVVFIRARVPESPVWENRQALNRQKGISTWGGIWNAIRKRPIVFLYVIVLMTAFNSLSHGTQDNLGTFLQKQLALGVSSTTLITVIANIGAIIGGTLFGYYSQYWGRRRAIIIACIIGIFMIPFWSGLIRIPGIGLLASIAIGAFLLQFMVQGAWGIIPAHLNELSPTNVRGTFPGLAYQLGNLFASFVVTLEVILAQNLGSVANPDLGKALAIFALCSFLAVILFTAIGREAREIDFRAADQAEAEAEEAYIPAPEGA
jgi:SHS family lactate transporter-like MFS transporter